MSWHQFPTSDPVYFPPSQVLVGWGYHDGSEPLTAADLEAAPGYQFAVSRADGDPRRFWDLLVEYHEFLDQLGQKAAGFLQQKGLTFDQVIGLAHSVWTVLPVEERRSACLDDIPKHPVLRHAVGVLWLHGLNEETIAIALDATTPLVQRTVEGAGWTPKDRRVVEMHHRGQSVTSIGRHLGHTHSWVRRVLVQADILADPRPPIPLKRVRRCAELRARGLSAIEIAERLGISRYQVYRALERSDG